MQSRKRFDRDLYNTYDGAAKKYAKSVLKTTEYEIEDNKKKTGVDLIVKKDNEIKFFIEVEIKTAIRDDEKFEYPTLNIASRKRKFCVLEYPTLFMIFSKSGLSYLCCWDKFILISPEREVKNKFVYSGETFFQINIKKHVDNNIKPALRRKWQR